MVYPKSNVEIPVELKHVVVTERIFLFLHVNIVPKVEFVLCVRSV